MNFNKLDRGAPDPGPVVQPAVAGFSVKSKDREGVELETRHATRADADRQADERKKNGHTNVIVAAAKAANATDLAKNGERLVDGLPLSLASRSASALEKFAAADNPARKAIAETELRSVKAAVEKHLSDVTSTAAISVVRGQSISEFFGG